MFEIRNSVFEELNIIAKAADAMIATRAKQAANLPGFVAMIDGKRASFFLACAAIMAFCCFWLLANSAHAVLLGKHDSVIVNGYTESVFQAARFYAFAAFVPIFRIISICLFAFLFIVALKGTAAIAANIQSPIGRCEIDVEFCDWLCRAAFSASPSSFCDWNYAGFSDCVFAAPLDREARFAINANVFSVPLELV